MSAKLRGILVSLGAIFALVLSTLIIYSTGQRRQYLLAKGHAEVLGIQFEAYQTTAEKEKAHLLADYQTAIIDRDNALINANLAAHHAGEIQAALELEQAKIKALPIDLLSGSINLRVGAGGSTPLANNTLSFTRPGAESTLAVFLEGEASAKKYLGEQSITASLRDAIDASERMGVSLSSRLTLTQGELDKLIPAYVARGDALRHLERSILGTKIKYVVIGGVTYVFVEKVVVPLVKLIFGIK